MSESQIRRFFPFLSPHYAANKGEGRSGYYVPPDHKVKNNLNITLQKLN